MESPLTDRQLRFVIEYLKDQNASAAAVRAGYSEKTRASQANELMNIPAVQERIRAELESLLAQARCSALELMKERMRAAFFRAEKMFGAGWEVLPLEQMEPETRAALEVSVVQRKSGPVLRMKQPDRDRALRALERVHERLERLNERYYARLEREGKVPTLEEIEAMDGGGVPADQILEKPQVFSGSEAKEPSRAASPSTSLRTGFDRLRTNGVGSDFSEKPQVLSGSRVAAENRGIDFSQKPQVLSGWGDGPKSGGRIFSAKTQVLSGFTGAGPARWQRRRVPDPVDAALPRPSWPPRPQASPWLLTNAAQSDAQMRRAA